MTVCVAGQGLPCRTEWFGLRLEGGKGSGTKVVVERGRRVLGVARPQGAGTALRDRRSPRSPGQMAAAWNRAAALQRRWGREGAAFGEAREEDDGIAAGWMRGEDSSAVPVPVPGPPGGPGGDGNAII